MPALWKKYCGRLHIKTRWGGSGVLLSPLRRAEDLHWVLSLQGFNMHALMINPFIMRVSSQTDWLWVLPLGPRWLRQTIEANNWTTSGSVQSLRWLTRGVDPFAGWSPKRGSLQRRRESKLAIYDPTTRTHSLSCHCTLSWVKEPTFFSPLLLALFSD